MLRCSGPFGVSGGCVWFLWPEDLLEPSTIHRTSYCMLLYLLSSCFHSASHSFTFLHFLHFLRIFGTKAFAPALPNPSIHWTEAPKISVLQLTSLLSYFPYYSFFLLLFILLSLLRSSSRLLLSLLRSRTFTDLLFHNSYCHFTLYLSSIVCMSSLARKST